MRRSKATPRVEVQIPTLAAPPKRKGGEMKIIIDPDAKTVLMKHGRDDKSGETFEKFSNMDVLLAWLKKYFDDMKIAERDFRAATGKGFFRGNLRN